MSTASASPVTPGFDFFTSNDALRDSLGASVDLGDFGLDSQVTVIAHNGSFPQCRPVEPVIVPQPASVALAALGGLTVAGRRRIS
ncbi:MAG: PEP-CTERM sorting domain-containing protein [Planctomycetes bacterium]|nr:PEP-CTERM sorting domain-containing protein [Planctomycetota bacterium]